MNSDATPSSTVLFLPEPGAWGPTNHLVALAEVLRERGHRTVFVLEESFRGVLDAKGFEEAHFRLGPPPERDEVVGDVWVEYIRATAPEFRKPTIEQLETVILPIWQELVGGARYAHERQAEIFAELRPDVAVVDCVSAFPAVLTAGVPWVRAMSTNPLELRDPALPPTFSGYSTEDESGWAEFSAEYERTHTDLHAGFSAFCEEAGAPPLAPLEFQYESPWLNLYAYPEAVDYRRARPLDATWHRLDTTVRAGERAFDVDEHLSGEGAVIYLSLGSLGSLDTALMQRLIDVLDRSEHRVIVSMGTLHTDLRLGERMYGEEFLPQPAILGQCDLLIHHGGNNTFNEALYFGLPTITLPLFWDQYDNAQRAVDAGTGVRLPSYDFADEDLLGAVDRLLADAALRGRLAGIREGIRANPGRLRGAGLIEALLRTGAPVVR